MYPSVYTFWRNPGIVPLLHTHEPVLKKLKGGADLMTPGLAGGPPFPEKAKKGAVVAIASTEHPSVPVALGVCEIDVCALQKVQGEKGHAVENLHWAGDEVWGFSPSGRAGIEAPEEIGGWMKVLEERNLVQKMGEVHVDDEDGDDSGGVSLEAPGTSAPNGINGSPATEEGAEIVADDEDSRELSQKDIDDVFRQAFLYGIHHHKTNQPSAPNHGLVFPLTQSFIVSTLINPFLPAFTSKQKEQFQIKKTSWKNIRKFVKSMDKDGMVKSKDKDGNETVILDIDFDDQAITSFRPYRLPKKETLAGTSQGRGDKATDAIDPGDDAVGQKLQVLSFYRSTSKLSPLFEGSGKQLYTPAEVRELITAYIERENLISETNRRLVELDPTLGNAVFDGSGSLDKEVLAKGSVPRDALIDRVLSSMATSYSIVRNGATDAAKPKSGSPPKIRILLETRSGNKTVTKVSGLEPYFINPRPLADELRKVCAGSTSVEPLAGAAKKNEREVMEVMVQGPQRDAVIKALERRGIDARRCIEVVDKTKKGKGR